VAIAPPLLVRFGAFGDMVLLTPLLGVLQRRFGQPVDLLSSGSWTQQLLEDDPRVGHIQLLTSRRAAYLLRPSQWQAVSWLRRRPAGPVYLCENDEKSLWLLRRAGIDLDWIVRAYDEPPRGIMHSIDWSAPIGNRTPAAYAAAPAPVVLQPDDFLPRLYVSETARRECAQWLAARGWQNVPLVLLQPGNKRTLKRGRLAGPADNKYWPPERWAAVARHLMAALPQAQLLLCGAPSEAGVLENIKRYCNTPQVHNLAHELPIRRLLPLLERAYCMISVDTGPAHAAAALECPLVVLFGEQNPWQMQPRSRQSAVVVLGGGSGGRVQDIKVEQVVRAWNRLNATLLQQPRDPLTALQPP
jgi:ADP-heptose:LPS heptosyltransferase